jgi:hypothetical protein
MNVFLNSLRLSQFFLCVFLLWSTCVIDAAEPDTQLASERDQAKIDFFEKRIRPVLVQQCYKCHSSKAQADGKLKGGLLLDSRSGLVSGGDSGPAIVVGNAADSLLVEAIRYSEDSLQMPPTGKLPAEVIADFEKWITTGAADPRDKSPAKNARAEIDWDHAREHWSIKRPKRHDPPMVKDVDWPRRRIDSFVLARMESAGLKPSPAASRRTMMRRACFDLLGLPPTPAQNQQFMSDESPAAYERLIDRLLDSPHYGERWARHWLDVARYAEDNTNMGPHNGPYPHAWRYRDWVVNALIEDVPYNDFIVRQLATDLLPDTGPEDHAALGFQGLAPSYHKEVALAKVVLENRYADEWEDRVDAIGRGLLGLTLACARCHDHKYDAVTVEDYYAVAGVFASSRQTTRPIITDEEIAKTQSVRDRVASIQSDVARWEKQIKELPKEIAALETSLKQHDKKSTSEDRPVDPISTEKETTVANVDADVDDNDSEFDPDKVRQRVDEATKQIEEAKRAVAAAKPEIMRLKKTPGFEIPVANALTEEQVRVEEITAEKMKIVYYANKPRDLNVFVRGDARRLGVVVHRGFLQLLSDGERVSFQKGSGRLELAREIVSSENPLTARVMVNRVWLHHFGTGLVNTPSNFGVSGSRPSHPSLLDDLAVRFMTQGWSLKWLHRQIMLSATYRQSTLGLALVDGTNSTLATRTAIDPDNRLLSHFNRRRLDAESFRDAVLACSGLLDPKLGGPSGDVDSIDFKRRTLYATVSRHKLSDTLQTFDFPDPAIHCAQRVETTTPLQQMFVLNSPFMRQAAVALAARVKQASGESVHERVRFSYRLLFAREPSDSEIQTAELFLRADPAETDTITESVTHGDAEAAEFTGSRVVARVKGLGDDYTLEAWIRNALAHNVRPVTGYFFSRGSELPQDDHGDHFGIGGTYGDSPGRLMFYSGVPHRQLVAGKTQLQVDQWYFVAVVRKGKSISIYLNGQAKPDAAGTANRGFKTGVEQIFIGGRRDNFANFNGQIRDVAIYNRALDGKQIAEHFNAYVQSANLDSQTDYTEAVIKSAPLGYWRLLSDPTNQSRATDLSGHSNHGRYEGRSEGKRVSRWERYVHALLSSNEFIYVD